MNITTTALKSEARKAAKSWPFLAELETAHGLPGMLLYAVGSRETNLTDEIGDGGHGHGVFQLDDRSHAIPNPFPVAAQAKKAAEMLAGAVNYFKAQGDGALKAGVAAYNCGLGGAASGLQNHGDPDYFTTGGDYAADVLERAAYLRKAFPAEAPMARRHRIMVRSLNRGWSKRHRGFIPADKLLVQTLDSNAARLLRSR